MKHPSIPQRLPLALALASAFALAACGDGDDSPPASTAIAASSCTSLSGKTISGGATVTAATVVAATGLQPEYCVAQVKLSDSALRFEAKLPTSGWNTKMVYLGGGGFNGNISQATQMEFSESVLTGRYATIATNGGHEAPASLLDYFKAEFAYDPVQLADYTNAKEHRTLPFAKELIRAAYGTNPARSYYEGCSMGGHDAMMESQRYPLDFDGIVARAPAGNIMGTFIQFNRLGKQVRAAAGTLNPAKQALLANAVLAQCDGLDGVADGIISKPAACNYNVAVLRCAGGADTGDSCLSDAQIATVNAVTTPIATSGGEWGHAGYNFGAENSATGWGEYVWPRAELGGDSLQGLFSDGFIRSFITRNGAYNTLAWNANDWLPAMANIGSMFSAIDPDLSVMAGRGAKLVMWNGETDTSISPRESSKYYDRVVAKMGKAEADKVVELFMAPGVGHCGGGVGPDKVDLLKSVATWVEQGTPPSAQNLVHKKLSTTGATTMTRPVCKYPAYPRYKGSGDTNDAANFSCSTL